MSSLVQNIYQQLIFKSSYEPKAPNLNRKLTSSGAVRIRCCTGKWQGAEISSESKFKWMYVKTMEKNGCVVCEEKMYSDGVDPPQLPPPFASEKHLHEKVLDKAREFLFSQSIEVPLKFLFKVILKVLSTRYPLVKTISEMLSDLDK